MSTTKAYELGRARGAAYGRTEPTEDDWEWLCCQPFGEPDADDLSDQERADFESGMLDGAEQDHAARIGLNGTPPPSAEAIEAAKDKVLS